MHNTFRIILILFLFTGLLTPVYIFAQEKQLPNAGFVSQNIWYSKKNFFAGDSVIIHAVITSDGEYNFLGTVKFYDNKKLLGSTDFSIKKGVYVEDAKIKWVSTFGDHNINALISNSRIFVNGKYISIVVSNNKSIANKSFVDMDTDGDKIGNREDLDDDGDGISDKEELKNGTDPLKKNINKTVNLKTVDVKSKVSSDFNTPNFSNNNKSFGETVGKLSNVAKGSVLPAISKITKKIFKVTEIARNMQEKFADKKIVKVRESIAKEKEKRGDKKKGSGARTPFNYASLLALTFLSYTSKYSALYYGLIGIAILYFIIILWKRWRR